jgi:hypothetical protein
MEQGINVTAEEMMDELVGRVTQLTMELSAKNIVIRKLEGLLKEQGIIEGDEANG